MIKNEVHQTLWLLKWALILSAIGAFSAVIIYLQWHLKWQIATPSYYINFFRELFTNSQYANGLFQFGLAAISGALIGAFIPLVFLFKK